MERIVKAARSSGSLNLSNRSLREVPNEVYRILETVGEGDKWWEAVELQKLILAHNEIQVLKEDLKNLSSLSVLNISYNKLSFLPAALGELQCLKSLDVSFNSIVCLPEEIGSVTSLVKLDCSNNLIKELPCSLGGCLNLSDLKASNNGMVKLPQDLANCSKLTKLDVEGNKLTMLCENNNLPWTMLMELNASKNLLSSIPDNIGILSRVVRLDFHQNKISSIPSSILACSSLAEFYMGSNMLTSLPSELGEVSHLGTLDLHSNQLKEFPVEACKLRLSVLDLSNNALSGLPPEIGTMTTLRKLLLTGNPLRSLRSSLVSGPTPALLRYLRSRASTTEDSGSASSPAKEIVSMAARLSISTKELSLSGLGLSSVPPEVWESGDITKVDLSKNSIEELPDGLMTCVSLQALILSKNKMKDWPGSVLRSLPNLTCLMLDNNPLKQIAAEGFEFLSKLEILDLSGNTGSLPEPPALSHLSNLKELYLRRVQLNEIRCDILTLQNLRILDVSQNRIVSVPPELKNLTCLNELDLSDNNISTLPPELGVLEPNLQALRLSGNPLRSIRRAILDRGTKAVLAYLKEKIPQ